MATQDPVLYVIADGEKARVLKLDAHQLRTVETLNVHKGSNAEHDVGDIKAPKTDPKLQLKTHFAHDVAAHINKLARDPLIEGIFLAAPAKDLHEIRTHLDKTGEKKVFRTLTKDLTNVPDHELLKHLDRPETGWPELAPV